MGAREISVNYLLGTDQCYPRCNHYSSQTNVIRRLLGHVIGVEALVDEAHVVVALDLGVAMRHRMMQAATAMCCADDTGRGVDPSFVVPIHTHWLGSQLSVTECGREAWIHYRAMR